MTRTCTFVGHYSTEWEERFELQIPEDADELDLEAALQRARQRPPGTGPDWPLADASLEGADWDGPAPTPGPARPETAPPWGYLEVPGHGRWLTDGSIAIREGRPLPGRSIHRSWVDTSELDPGRLVELLDRPTAAEAPGPYTPPPAAALEGRKGAAQLARARRWYEVLEGLEVGYLATAAVGRDAAGVPQALAMLWEPEPTPVEVDLEAGVRPTPRQIELHAALMRWYHRRVHGLGEGPAPLPDATLDELLVAQRAVKAWRPRTPGDPSSRRFHFVVDESALALEWASVQRAGYHEGADGGVQVRTDDAAEGKVSLSIETDDGVTVRLTLDVDDAREIAWRLLGAVGSVLA